VTALLGPPPSPGRATWSTGVPGYQQGYCDCPRIVWVMRGPGRQSPVIFPAHTPRHQGQLTVAIGGASGSVNRSSCPDSVRHMSVTCDARSHIVSEMTDWRAEMIGGLSSG
jgi:hypothetical protein